MKLPQCLCNDSRLSSSKQKSEIRSKGRSQSRRRRHKGLRCASSLLKSFVREKNLKQNSQKHIRVQLFCVLIKRNDYLKLLRSVPLAFFCFKLKLHNLTVNLIIHSAVQKNGTKRNKAESKCISNKNGWRKKFQCRRQKSVRQFVSLSAFWQLKLCELCFFSGFSAFNFGFFCRFCFKWLSWNQLSLYSLFDILLQFFFAGAQLHYVSPFSRLWYI